MPTAVDKQIQEAFDAIVKQYGPAGVVSIHAQWKTLRDRWTKQRGRARTQRLQNKAAMVFARKHGFTNSEDDMDLDEKTE